MPILYYMLGVFGEGRLLISVLSQIRRFGEVALEVLYFSNHTQVALLVSGPDLGVELMDFGLML